MHITAVSMGALKSTPAEDCHFWADEEGGIYLLVHYYPSEDAGWALVPLLRDVLHTAAITRDGWHPTAEEAVEGCEPASSFTLRVERISQ